MKLAFYSALVPVFLYALVVASPFEVAAVLAACLRRLRTLRVGWLVRAQYRKFTKSFLAKHGGSGEKTRLACEIMREHKEEVITRLAAKCEQALPELPWWIQKF